MEILNVVHNIVSVTPEYLSERHLDGRGIYYMKDQDMIAVVGWERDTKRIGEMIVNYLELSPEGRQEAEAFFILPAHPVRRLHDFPVSLHELRVVELQPLFLGFYHACKVFLCHPITAL